MKVTIKSGLKLPIKGVAFSNQELGLEVEQEIDDGNYESLEKELSEVVKKMVDKYTAMLEEELASNQGDLLAKLQIQIGKDYEDKLDKARDMIIKLQDTLKENGIQY